MMRVFTSYSSYLKALEGQERLAILPLAPASELVLRGERTVKNWIMSGQLAGVKIEDQIYPLASAVLAHVSQREKEVDTLYKRLVTHVTEDGSILFYSDLMEEFGYSHRIPADRKHFGFLLGDCSRISKKRMEGDGFADDGYFISSFVWLKPQRGQEPKDIGEGYWDLVSSVTGETISDQQRQAYVKLHMKKCIKFYRRK
jgi:hypothetical protein